MGCRAGPNNTGKARKHNLLQLFDDEALNKVPKMGMKCESRFLQLMKLCLECEIE